MKIQGQGIPILYSLLFGLSNLNSRLVLFKDVQEVFGAHWRHDNTLRLSGGHRLLRILFGPRVPKL